MDFLTQKIIQDNARRAAEEIERKKRLDPNYKPTSLAKLLFWPVGIIVVLALLFFYMGR